MPEDERAPARAKAGRIGRRHASCKQLEQLRQELQSATSQLRALREEYEGANKELRAANEELRVREAHGRAVIDAVADAIMRIDERGAIRSMNAAATRMFRAPAAELIGRDVNELAPDAFPASSQATMRESREVEARRVDGSLFPAEVSVSEIRHGGERLFIGLIRDLSEARLGRLRANRLDSMSDTASALVHELNQPLAAASNYFALARRLVGEPASPALKVAPEKASGQLMRAGRIIARLRDFMAGGEP